MDTGRPAGDHSRTDDKSELGGSREHEEDCSFREASELGFKGSCKIINRKAKPRDKGCFPKPRFAGGGDMPVIPALWTANHASLGCIKQILSKVHARNQVQEKTKESKW